MIRLISVKCPDCGAALQLEEGRQTAFCSYCGTKILLHNENEHIIRNIDEAGIRQAENDRAYMMKELELEEKDEKHHRFLTFVWLFCTILLFTVGFIRISTGTRDGDDWGHMMIVFGMLIGVWGWLMLSLGTRKHRKNRNRPGYAKMPEQAVNCENLHFTAVRDALKANGFSDIRLINLGDLRLGIFRKNGSVESVTIDGDTVSSDDWYPQSGKIIISYHGFPENS